jgi:hypothetical protein
MKKVSFLICVLCCKLSYSQIQNCADSILKVDYNDWVYEASGGEFFYCGLSPDDTDTKFDYVILTDKCDKVYCLETNKKTGSVERGLYSLYSNKDGYCWGKDSVWETFDPTGKLIYLKYYENGVFKYALEPQIQDVKVKYE